jgi:hypothetical protein
MGIPDRHTSTTREKSGAASLLLIGSTEAPEPDGQPKAAHGGQAWLFGEDRAPPAPTRTERLRVDVGSIVKAGGRGLRARLAEALGFKHRSPISNFINGKYDLNDTAERLLRQWADGEPMPANWPELPRAKEDHDAAAA